MSGTNGIAGSFAHNVPILHIVGCPNSVVIEHDIPIHHTLANFQKNSFLGRVSDKLGAANKQ